jgi:hypothetical protein
MYGALLLCNVNGRQINRYLWLEQKKVASTEPDHREKEDELRN